MPQYNTKYQDLLNRTEIVINGHPSRYQAVLQVSNLAKKSQRYGNKEDLSSTHIIKSIVEISDLIIIDSIIEESAIISTEYSRRLSNQSKEKEIQIFLSQYLTNQGIANKLEYACGNNRENYVDIFLPELSTVIEVKKIINKDSIWRGKSQLDTYARECGARYKLLIGFLPDKIEERNRIYNLIEIEEKWNFKIKMLEPDELNLGLDNIFRSEHIDESDLESIVKNVYRRIIEIIYAYIESMRNTTREVMVTGINNLFDFN
jgi:hypothetical protein